MTLGDGVRRNIASVDPSERQLLLNAILTLNSRFYPGSRTDLVPGHVSEWFKQDEIHQATHVHNGPEFVPWHRVMVNRFEGLLRAIDPRLSLHYWDWRQDPRAIPNANLGNGTTGTLNLFTAGFMGWGGANPSPIGAPWEAAGFYQPATAQNRDATGNPADPPRLVSRSVNGSPATGNDDDAIITAGDYTTMRGRLETVHNSMHGFVNMGSAHISFRDPFVFLLHSNVDRLFARWQTELSMPQRLDPATVYGPESGVAELNGNVEPWSTGHSFDQFGVEHFTRPWCAPENLGVPVTYKDPSVVTPPKYDSNVRAPGGINDGRPFWTGDFTGNGATDVLFYYPGDDNWWLGTITNGALGWSLVGNTAGFGHGINDGRPFWTGDFTGNGATDVLFYYPGDDNWWLGTLVNGALTWTLVGNTAGFGHGINDGRPFWTGDFTGNGATDVLFYYPGDDNWWLGTLVNGALGWTLVGNTAGFGHGINDGRPFWTGDFTGNGATDVLFYYPGDDNWWLGTLVNGALTWTLVGNTAGFGHGINDGRPFWTGDFTGNGATDVLFYYPGDDNWWLGTLVNGALTWTLVGNTAGFGHGINDGRPFWTGDFTGNGTTDVLFSYPGDDNWWLGTIDPVPAEVSICATLRAKIAGERNEIGLLQASLRGLDPRNLADRREILQIRREIATIRRQITQDQAQMDANGCPVNPNTGGVALSWSHVGNTIGFGHAINDGRPFWVGDFTGNGSTDVLFYYPGDDNWWLGAIDPVSDDLSWSFVGNTAGFAGR